MQFKTISILWVSDFLIQMLSHLFPLRDMQIKNEVVKEVSKLIFEKIIHFVNRLGLFYLGYACTL